MFSKALDWEIISESVLTRVRKVKAVKENKRLRFLSAEEIRDLLNTCSRSADPLLAPIVSTALNTGKRKGEILGLEWYRHIDLKHGFFTLDKTKNGHRREIPINVTLRGVLQGLTRRLDVPSFVLRTQGSAY